MRLAKSKDKKIFRRWFLIIEFLHFEIAKHSPFEVHESVRRLQKTSRHSKTWSLIKNLGQSFCCPKQNLNDFSMTSQIGIPKLIPLHNPKSACLKIVESSILTRKLWAIVVSNKLSLEKTKYAMIKIGNLSNSENLEFNQLELHLDKRTISV